MKSSSIAKIKTNLKKIIVQQTRLHPNFKVEDLYKLLYQAVFGPGHLLDHSALPMLREEMANAARLGKKELLEEPLFELIDPKGDVYRVNLRPFKKTGGDPETLFAVMVESAQTLKGNKKVFLQYWKLYEELAHAGLIPFTEKALVDFRNFFTKKKIPATHHSPAYRKAHRPAYRIVLKKLLKKIKNPV